MAWQPTAIIYADVELEVTTAIRSMLADRDEDAWVDRKVPNPRRERMVIFTRDGGTASNFRDVARIRTRVWAPTYDAAIDLARLVQALMPTLADGATVLKVEHLSGPYEIPDDSAEAQVYMLFEVHTRGGDLP